MSAKVHIIDDDEAIRDALSWLLQSRGVESTTWSSAKGFLDAWEQAEADFQGCLLLDIRMDGMSGLELFDLLQGRGLALPVIFLTGHGDVPMAVSALKKGAFDFVEKPFNDNELVNRVIEAMDTDARNQAKQAINASVQSRLNTLTTRERQIMDLILEGKFNKVIADDLQISMRTVEVHRAHLFEKMGVRTAVELAQLLKP
ncbi:DNA-binding response regulator [Azospira sp. I13]|uniref:response regulator transcription factor n=1 Tax=Azospira sp. I13 TaxID=1765050 RepID=UPI000D4343A7|nr:response regulator [Azospira sp. I13]GBG01428.1 DNA-binding response regulator [Azospira sp. I13]